ncbi:MAG: MFS transporter [Negativicutes bacterium]|nr:MFS transporter [Negativicutes bacterium]
MTDKHRTSIRDNLRQTWKHWQVLLAGGLAHFTHDGFADMLYVLFPLWQVQFGLSFAEVGFCKTLWSGSLAVFQVPAGMLARRVGEVPLLLVGTAVACGSVIAYGWAASPLALACLLIIGGIGESVQHPLASALISNAYQEKGLRRAALSTYNFTGDIGKLFFPAAAALLITQFDWPTATRVLGVFGLVVLVVIFVVTKKIASVVAPSGDKADNCQKVVGQHNVKDGEQAFWSLVLIGIVDSATRMGFLTFFPFLLRAKGADVAMIGLTLSLIFAGGATGKFICGVVATRFGILRTVIVTEVLTAVCIWAMLALSPGVALLLSPLLGVALNGTSSVLYGSVPELVSEERRNQAFAIFYTAGIGSGAVSPFIYGFVSDAIGVETTLVVVAVVVLTIVPLTLPLRGKLVQ